MTTSSSSLRDCHRGQVVDVEESCESMVDCVKFSLETKNAALAKDWQPRSPVNALAMTIETHFPDDQHPFPCFLGGKIHYQNTSLKTHRVFLLTCSKHMHRLIHIEKWLCEQISLAKTLVRQEFCCHQYQQKSDWSVRIEILMYRYATVKVIPELGDVKYHILAVDRSLSNMSIRHEFPPPPLPPPSLSPPLEPQTSRLSIKKKTKKRR